MLQFIVQFIECEKNNINKLTWFYLILTCFERESVMYNMYQVFINVLFTIIISLSITPFIRRLSLKIGAVDEPNNRRVNKVAVPSMGGLAIYLTFFIAIFFLQPIALETSIPIFIASTIVIITGVVDDIKDIKPIVKILGLLVASVVVIFMNNLTVEKINIPFWGDVSVPLWIGVPFTILWILAITNSVNLIDGLDGLASGVSIISLTTIGIISLFFLGFGNTHIEVTILIFTLVGAIVGFIPYNFFPAKLYLGDTGSLFIGFMVSMLSLYGLKNITLISLLIPIVILGVPITDTVYAMLRRYLNNKPISSADKEHMHHRLMSLGLTHRQTVLFIYMIATIFSMIGLLYPMSTLIGSILITIALVIGVEIFVELIGLVGEDRAPLLNIVRNFALKLNKNHKKNR